jgi:peptidoglycan/xylan/chitin deacetylase (PgdA/CDA1 family)
MNALISLTFDDGLRCQFERALPLLNAHGIPATFFLIANKRGAIKESIWQPRWKKTNWSAKDVQLFTKMIREGHEIGSHSVHHKRTYLDRDPDFEVGMSKEWIEHRLGVEVASYCYPFCHFTENIRDAVIRAGYQQARWGANGTYYPLQDRLDAFKIDCRMISKVGYERVGKTFVGQFGAEDVAGWLRPGCWHVLMYHGIGTFKDGWWPIPESEFARQMKDLTELRESGRAEIVTFGEGARRARIAAGD